MIVMAAGVTSIAGFAKSCRTSSAGRIVENDLVGIKEFSLSKLASSAVVSSESKTPGK